MTFNLIPIFPLDGLAHPDGDLARWAERYRDSTGSSLILSHRVLGIVTGVNLFGYGSARSSIVLGHLFTEE